MVELEQIDVQFFFLVTYQSSLFKLGFFHKLKNEILIQVCFFEVILPVEATTLQMFSKKTILLPFTCIDKIELQTSSSEDMPDNWA